MKFIHKMDAHSHADPNTLTALTAASAAGSPAPHKDPPHTAATQDGAAPTALLQPLTVSSALCQQTESNRMRPFVSR